MLPFILDFQGELAALTAALIWAIASVFYTGFGRTMPALMLNLVKCLIAIVLFAVTLWWRGAWVVTLSPLTIWVLAVSGVIGIGLGDTAYFLALQRLGPRRSLVLESLAPPIAAIIAWVALGERLSWLGWGGVLLTIGGVVWVVVERTQDPQHPIVQPLWGIGYGLVAALCQAVGAVLSRAALANTDVDPMWSSVIRLTAGALVLLAWVLLKRTLLGSAAKIRPQLRKLSDRRWFLTLIGTAFASTYLAIWLQQVSLKYAAAGVAQSLSSTSPLFITAIALGMGERISLRAILGVLVAMGGIWLLFLR